MTIDQELINCLLVASDKAKESQADPLEVCAKLWEMIGDGSGGEYAVLKNNGKALRVISHVSEPVEGQTVQNEMSGWLPVKINPDFMAHTFYCSESVPLESLIE